MLRDNIESLRPRALVYSVGPSRSHRTYQIQLVLEALLIRLSASFKTLENMVIHGELTRNVG
jgi:hypothetical protein